MMNPTLGRFSQRDPATFIDGPNDYQYVLSNPVNRLDAMGLQVQYPDPGEGGGNPYYDPHSWAAYDSAESDCKVIRMKLADAQQARDAWLPYLSKMSFGDQADFRNWDKDVSLWKLKLETVCDDQCMQDYTPPKWEKPTRAVTGIVGNLLTITITGPYGTVSRVVISLYGYGVSQGWW